MARRRRIHPHHHAKVGQALVLAPLNDQGVDEVDRQAHGVSRAEGWVGPLGCHSTSHPPHLPWSKDRRITHGGFQGPNAEGGSSYTHCTSQTPPPTRNALPGKACQRSLSSIDRSVAFPNMSDIQSNMPKECTCSVWVWVWGWVCVLRI